MTVIEQSALLPYSDQDIFNLVNDIESYPEFMDGCIGAEVLSANGRQVTARLDLGKAGFRYSLTTKNHLNPPHSMLMELEEGPFKKFDACWNFIALGDNACKASLNMTFEFKSGLLDFALRGIFDNASKNLVNAVILRAHKIYGKPGK